MAEVEAPKRRTFRKFTYRGVDLEQLLDMGTEELTELLPARARRKLHRGLKRKPLALIKKLRNAKKSAEAGETPWRRPLAILELYYHVDCELSGSLDRRRSWWGISGPDHESDLAVAAARAVQHIVERIACRISASMAR